MKKSSFNINRFSFVRNYLYSKNRKKSIWFEKRIDRHVQFIALFFFIGIGLIAGFGCYSLISWDYISRIFFGVAVVCSFIPVKFFPLLYRIRKELKVLFIVCALSPMIVGILLLLNYTITTQSVNESYKIERVVHYSNDYIFKVELENNKFEKHKSIRSFSADVYGFTPDSAHYTVNMGMLGIRVIKGAYLTRRK